MSSIFEDLWACTQVLFGYAAFEARWPGLVRAWLAYHVHVLGIDAMLVYDWDGSFAPVVRPAPAWTSLNRESECTRQFLLPVRC